MDYVILTNEGNHGKGAFTIGKPLAMGLRKPPSRILTEDEIKLLKDDIQAIAADESRFVFNDKRVRGTSYRPQDDMVYVKGNVLSDPHSTHPRDIMSPRAVLAHAYYGHRPYRAQYLSEMEKQDLGDDSTILRIADREWADEFRASYVAAKTAPQLTEEDRRHLVLDALDRAREAGVSIKHNAYIREVLYGYSKTG